MTAETGEEAKHFNFYYFLFAPSLAADITFYGYLPPCPFPGPALFLKQWVF